MNDENTTPQGGEDYEIVLIGIEGTQYFLYKGEDHINQLLLADGEFPCPVHCLNFSSMIDVRIELGQAVNVSQFWGIHPEIVARLRDMNDLVETDF